MFLPQLWWYDVDVQENTLYTSHKQHAVAKAKPTSYSLGNCRR